jgi:succinate-semialdehyde dehydrogenase/glutarate-semialdehyde dehydrogenase
MTAACEEVFGPVAAMMKVRDAEEAVAIANASPFGLGASLWTSDLNRARRLAPGIESGQVFINGMVASDPRLPFGGVKRSGYGRELSEFGIREFVNIQTVWIGPAR